MKYKGRDFLIRASDELASPTFSTIANMRSNSFKLNQEQIDVTDKSGNGWRELLAGGIRSAELSGEGVVSDAATLVALEDAFNLGLINRYSLVSGRGDSYVGGWQIGNFERSGENPSEEKFSCSFMSSGEVVRCKGAPTITAAGSPSTGPAAGGTTVTITGTNFVPHLDSANAPIVKFGNALATNVVVVSPTQITCTSPAGSIGSVGITVINPDGRSVTRAASFTYA